MVGIYAITNLVTGHQYVGQSTDIKRRWWDHRTLLRANKNRPNVILQRAWNKYGEAQFSFSVLQEVPENLLVEAEQFWLDSLKPKYNIAKSSKSNKGIKHSVETKAKYSAAQRGRRYKQRIARSAEHREKLRIAQTGKQQPEEVRLKKGLSSKQAWEQKKSDIPPGHQQCSECRKVLSFDHFHRNKAQLFGYCHSCKSCRSNSRRAGR